MTWQWGIADNAEFPHVWIEQDGKCMATLSLDDAEIAQWVAEEMERAS